MDAENKADWCSLDKAGEHEQPKRDYVSRTLPPRDRLQGVYFAATSHDEDQPVHLVIHDTNPTAGSDSPAVVGFRAGGMKRLVVDQRGRTFRRRWTYQLASGSSNG